MSDARSCDRRHAPWAFVGAGEGRSALPSTCDKSDLQNHAVLGTLGAVNRDLLEHIRTHMGQQHPLGPNLRQMLPQARPIRMKRHLPVEGLARCNEHIRASRGLAEHRDPFRVPGIAEGLVPDLAAQRERRGS